MKLTDRQWEYLFEAQAMVALCPCYGWGSTAKSLVEKGLIKEISDSLTRTKTYRITEAGRSALKEREG